MERPDLSGNIPTRFVGSHSTTHFTVGCSRQSPGPVHTCERFEGRINGIALSGSAARQPAPPMPQQGAQPPDYPTAADYDWASYSEPAEGQHMWPDRTIDYTQYGYDISMHPVCAQVNLNELQREICARKPHSMPLVSDGARTGIFECQHQFKYERWNCSNIQEDESDLLGPTMRSANKETAFVSAVTSAGIVYQITRGCSLGALSECGCDNNYRGRELHPDEPKNAGPQGTWTWGGCSDNVNYGIKFSEQFLDAWEQQQHLLTEDRKVAVTHLMNIHNHRVGRESVRAKVNVSCRCHGVSGSCEMRVCWRRMASFNEIGDLLKSRYDYYSVRVAKRAKTPLRRKDRQVRDTPILPDRELVYLHKSPNYCARDPANGVFGTVGRVCNATSVGRESCHLLCCGRGYDTSVETWNERCHCKFVWCCEVKCKLCARSAEVHTCK